MFRFLLSFGEKLEIFLILKIKLEIKNVSNCPSPRTGCLDRWMVGRGEEGQPQQFLVHATFTSLSCPSHLQNPRPFIILFLCPKEAKLKNMFSSRIGHIKIITIEGKWFQGAWTRYYCDWPSSPRWMVGRFWHPLFSNFDTICQIFKLNQTTLTSFMHVWIYIIHDISDLLIDIRIYMMFHTYLWILGYIWYLILFYEY